MDAIDRLQAAYEASNTNAPWHHYDLGYSNGLGMRATYGVHVNIGSAVEMRDAAHIVGMHNATPALLAVAKAAAEIDRAQHDPRWPGWETVTGWDDAFNDLEDALTALTEAVGE